MCFRNSHVDKQRTSVAEKSSGPPGGPGKESEVRFDRVEPTENTDVGEEGDGALETSFRHLWSDYSVDWKDTRRYPGDGAAAPHRKLCTPPRFPFKTVCHCFSAKK